MTNNEIMKELKEIRKEGQKERSELRTEVFALKLELAIFKSKSFGFMAALSLIFTLITNVGISYLTKDKL